MDQDGIKPRVKRRTSGRKWENRRSADVTSHWSEADAQRKAYNKIQEKMRLRKTRSVCCVWV